MARPKLDDVLPLVAALKENGVLLGAAPDISYALAQGPDWYAAELAKDADKWRKFRHSLAVLEGKREGEAEAWDHAVLGALAWFHLLGTAFLDSVRDRMMHPYPRLVS